jgi:serine/threonine protein kinase
VDMWSVGCILYFLLYGVPPFYSDKEDELEQEKEIVDAILKGKIHFLEHIQVSSQGSILFAN